MPELPEVEIAARNLRRWLEGEEILDAEIAKSPVVRGSSPQAIARLLVGRTIEKVGRRGKWLELLLSGGAALYAHLGMTGKWVHRPTGAPADRWQRARLETHRASVRYIDPRLFGRLHPAPDRAPPAAFAALGPDPLVDGIDLERLAERLARTSRSIKETLMDQTVLAGVGNIQAAEALWRARVHPQMPSRAVAADGKLVKAIAKGIHDSIAFTLAQEGEPDEITYVEEPGAPNPFKVYGRERERCPRCKTPIQRIVQGGRSTFLCPKCQPKRRARARRY